MADLDVTAVGASLQYLTIAQASQVQMEHYINVACLTLCVWDWIIAIPDELEIARRAFKSGGVQGRATNTAYFMCRLSTLCIHLVGVAMNMIPFESCVGVSRALGALNTIASPATALLFCARASAVYLHARPAVLFFGLSWAALFANFVADGRTAAYFVSAFKEAIAFGFVLQVATFYADLRMSKGVRRGELSRERLMHADGMA
ncbi:hypothetical protein HWV62_17834 [Athelia sp. TMB]|nr:hypothetical protein HWV62_17834 [Athelia sp. TMB]